MERDFEMGVMYAIRCRSMISLLSGQCAGFEVKRVVCRCWMKGGSWSSILLRLLIRWIFCSVAEVSTVSWSPCKLSPALPGCQVLCITR